MPNDIDTQYYGAAAMRDMQPADSVNPKRPTSLLTGQNLAPSADEPTSPNAGLGSIDHGNQAPQIGAPLTSSYPSMSTEDALVQIMALMNKTSQNQLSTSSQSLQNLNQKAQAAEANTLKNIKDGLAQAQKAEHHRKHSGIFGWLKKIFSVVASVFAVVVAYTATGLSFGATAALAVLATAALASTVTSLASSISQALGHAGFDAVAGFMDPGNLVGKAVAAVAKDLGASAEVANIIGGAAALVAAVVVAVVCYKIAVAPVVASVGAEVAGVEMATLGADASGAAVNAASAATAAAEDAAGGAEAVANGVEDTVASVAQKASRAEGEAASAEEEMASAQKKAPSAGRTADAAAQQDLATNQSNVRKAELVQHVAHIVSAVSQVALNAEDISVANAEYAANKDAAQEKEDAAASLARQNQIQEVESEIKKVLNGLEAMTGIVTAVIKDAHESRQQISTNMLGSGPI